MRTQLGIPLPASRKDSTKDTTTENAQHRRTNTPPLSGNFATENMEGNKTPSQTAENPTDDSTVPPARHFSNSSTELNEEAAMIDDDNEIPQVHIPTSESSKQNQKDDGADAADQNETINSGVASPAASKDSQLGPTSPIEEPDIEAETVLELTSALRFKDWATFEAHFNNWKYENFTHTSIKDSKINKAENNGTHKYIYADIKCVHFGQPRLTETKQKRKNQSYMAVGCLFGFVVKLDARTQEYYLDKLHLEHRNHEVSQESYRQHPQARRLKDPEIEKYVSDYLMTMNASKATLKEKILKETGKIVTSKDLQNYKDRLQRKSGRSEVNRAVALLEEAENSNPGSTMRILYRRDDNDGKHIIKAILWQSAIMKLVLEKNASLLFLDGTYNLVNTGYIMITFTVISHQKKSHLVGWILISNEKQETLQGALTMFRDENEEKAREIEYVIVDKDFQEISAIAHILPNAIFIICRYHALECVKRKIHSLKMEKEVQEQLNDLFVKMVYAISAEIYDANWEKMSRFNPLTNEVKQFLEYIDINWHSHKEHWALYLLKNRKLYESYTNNRAENCHMLIKKRIPKRSPFDVVVQKMLSFSEDQTSTLKSRDWATQNKQFMPTDAHNDRFKEEIVRVGNALGLSSTIKIDILAQYDDINTVLEETVDTARDQTICSRTKPGPCTFNSSMHLPCKHLLFVRKHNLEAMLTEEMIEEKWLHQVDFKKTLPKQRGNAFKKMPAARRKFFTAKDAVSDITSFLQSCDDEMIEEKTAEMQEMTDAWKRKIESTSGDKSDGPAIYEDEDGAAFILKSSPGKRSHLSNKNATRTIKRRRLDPNAAPAAPKPLDDWMVQCNRKLQQVLNSEQFSRLDFDVLTDKQLTGCDLYLTDNHMDVAGSLILSKFPNFAGFNPTVLYSSSGFKPIEVGKTFIQPIYAGGPHWLTLSNVELDESKRSNEVDVYDSFLHFKTNSKTQFRINPATTWQAAQLVKDPQHDEKTPRSIFLNIKICHQQPNYTDCGLYAIGTAISLSFGDHPADIQYKGDLRSQLMDMVSTPVLRQFEHLDRGQEGFEPKRFAVSSNVGFVVDSIIFKETRLKVDLIGHCQMPAGYGNVFTCNKCHHDFHLKCYLMEKSAMDSYFGREDPFYCYNCREAGVYEFLKTDQQPDEAAIEKLTEKMEKNKTYRIHRYIPEVKRLHKRVSELVTTRGQLKLLSEIYTRYDLNAACHKTGAVYTCFYNWYYNTEFQSGTARRNPIEHFTKAELIHFLLLLICDIENLDCPPIYYEKSEPVQGQSKFEKVHKDNIKWTKDLIKMSVDLTKKIEKFIGTRRKIQDILDAMSTFNRDLSNLDDYTMKLMEKYTEAVTETEMTADMKTKKEKAWETMSTILTNVQADQLILRKYQNDIFEEEGVQ